MFEKNLVESRPFAASSSQRWTAVVSITLQCSLAALLLTLPLLHPERLGRLMSVREILPPVQPPPRPPKQAQARVAAASSSAAGSASAQPALLSPHGIPSRINLSADTSEAPVAKFGSGWGDGPPLAIGSGLGDGVSAHVSIVPARPLRVSAGVSQGLLIAPIRPVYPQIARTAHVEGVVVVEAVISKAGRIESARAVSGPAMLRQAALDAVGAARYSRFQLNGESTEVETTITITFRLGS
jgi:periplasmic protein TonB